jgi:thioredoxin-like negative regulator of GroEL
MIGLAIPLLCAAILLAALLVARPGAAAVQLAAAFLVLGLAGYVWQGRPGLPGSPTEARASRLGGATLFSQERGAFFEKLGAEAQVLDTADALIANGNADYAAGILRGALSRNPDSATLWVGYANALTAYADGVVTPAARLAFERGAARARANPAAPYFLALALAQSGDLDGAEAIWTALRPAMAQRPQWRALLEQKLTALARIRGAMGG